MCGIVVGTHMPHFIVIDVQLHTGFWIELFPRPLAIFFTLMVDIDQWAIVEAPAFHHARIAIIQVVVVTRSFTPQISVQTAANRPVIQCDHLETTGTFEDG